MKELWGSKMRVYRFSVFRRTHINYKAFKGGQEYPIYIGKINNWFRRVFTKRDSLSSTRTAAESRKLLPRQKTLHKKSIKSVGGVYVRQKRWNLHALVVNNS